MFIMHLILPSLLNRVIHLPCAKDQLKTFVPLTLIRPSKLGLIMDTVAIGPMHRGEFPSKPVESKGTPCMGGWQDWALTDGF